MKLLKYYLPFLIAILLCLLLFYKCYNTTDPVIRIVERDTIAPKIAANKADIKQLNDSVPILYALLKKAKDRKNYYKQKYRSVFDSIYSASDSTCRESLLVIELQKLKQDSAHESQILAQKALTDNAFEQIDNYKENQGLYDVRHKLDSTKIGYLINDSIPSAIKYYGKKRFWKGFKIGLGAGAIIVEAANVASKIKP
jgi:hypothetical protein